jgi:hypothetical protein
MVRVELLPAPTPLRVGGSKTELRVFVYSQTTPQVRVTCWRPDKQLSAELHPLVAAMIFSTPPNWLRDKVLSAPR